MTLRPRRKEKKMLSALSCPELPPTQTVVSKAGKNLEGGGDLSKPAALPKENHFENTTHLLKK